MTFADRVLSRDWGVAVVRIAVVAIATAMWQLAPADVLSPRLASRPTDVGARIWELLTSWEFYHPHLTSTTYEMAAGLLIGAPVGILLAVIFEGSKPLRWLFEPIMLVLYAIPKVVLISLFILWFGIESRSKVALVLSFVVFIFYVGMRQALREQDPDRRLALALMGAGPLFRLRCLTIPSSVPHLISSLRLAVPLAFGAAIFAELNIASDSGLGGLLGQAAGTLDASTTIAIVLLVGAIGFGLDTLMSATMRGRAARQTIAVRL